MNTQCDNMLTEVQTDIAAIESKIELVKKQLEPLEARRSELQVVKQYLLGKCESAVTTATCPIAEPKSPPIADTAPEAFTTRPEIVTSSQIAGMAEIMLRERGPGRWVRANEVARRLVDGYDPEKDARGFETRVYSCLARKSSITKIARGKFALAEYVKANPELYPNSEEVLLTEMEAM